MKKVLALLCLLPAPLAAQRLQFTFGGTGAQEIVNSRVDPAFERLTGLVLGGEGLVMSDRLVGRLRYAQGHVTGAAGSSITPRDIVEGEALVGFRAMPWLTLWAGPSARAYTSANGDQRWFFWSGRATARGSLLPGRMQTFVELWSSLSGNVRTPATTASGRGAEAGLEMRLGQQAFWGRLAYSIESGHATSKRETVEAISLSLIYGLPQ
ncbi:MAG TPA: hypothetical protein VN908_07985 [Gemmatimonadales bacterium]|nr:hypothetical protein [Gemmatimonadales bacterium]